nr:hypothetical protein [Bacillus swezeyi]
MDQPVAIMLQEKFPLQGALLSFDDKRHYKSVYNHDFANPAAPNKVPHAKIEQGDILPAADARLFVRSIFASICLSK